ncbi:MAG: HupE/UreJ family protein [Myxococcales bacterium]|nr:HupE/UreJ family protein [Myxococcales bacterium]
MSPRCLALLVLVLAWLWPGEAGAHGLRPGVLSLHEDQPGSFTVMWTEPVDTSGPAASIELVFPEPCELHDDRLECGPEGLQGELAFRGLAEGHDRVMTLVRFRDGRTLEAMVTAAEPRLELRAGPGRSAGAWISLGLRHIVGGLDHVAFVLGLLMVVGTRGAGRLLATITAFTVAHSLTLALAVTNTLTLAAAPVEATIAASVVLVAREATHDRPTLTRRAPWLVAFAFGLVHGLGFAGALAQWGLPPGWVGGSLLCFNLGVELGQLAIVGVVVAVVALGRGVLERRPARRPAAYALGGLAAWWLLERTLAIVAPGGLTGS